MTLLLQDMIDCRVHVILPSLVLDRSLLNGTPRAAWSRFLTGYPLVGTHRHGKWLFLRAESGVWLVLHRGMTGDLHVLDRYEPAPRYVRLRLRFRDGASLVFTDPRRFGEAGLTNDAGAFLRARKWGPDPTHDGFDRHAFRSLLSGRTGNLKGVLLNQQIISGIGNLYADEMLYQCGLHPETRVSSLNPRSIDALYDAMMDVFEASIAVETRFEDLPDRFLLHHRNDTGLCPKCRRPLKTMTAGGRTTYYCPTHQRRRS
jgi:formamidopyrimidine-DNA glycosylase